MDKITFFKSYFEAIDNLPHKSQNILYKAIFTYAFQNVEPSLSGIENSVWLLIKPNLDCSIKKTNGGANGGKKTQAQPKHTASIPQAQPKHTASDKEVEKEKDLDKDKDVGLGNMEVVEKETLSEKTTAAVAAYEANIAPITQMIFEKLCDWLNDVDLSLVEYAIEQAVVCNKRNWSYIHAIINNHFTSGRTTRIEAENHHGHKQGGIRDKPNTLGVLADIISAEEGAPH